MIFYAILVNIYLNAYLLTIDTGQISHIFIAYLLHIYDHNKNSEWLILLRQLTKSVY